MKRGEKDRSPVAKDLKGDESWVVKEKEVMKSEKKEEDADDAGVREGFVNSMGGKTQKQRHHICIFLIL